MSCIVRWLVLDFQADWQPALLDLWVRVGCGAIVSIDLVQQRNAYLILVSCNRLIEDNLKVAVEIVVIQVVVWVASTVEGDVSHCKFLSLSTLWSTEIKSASRWQCCLEEPVIPV